MLKPLEFAIGLRYTRAKRRNQFVSFISLSSVIGIALGVMALITVLSVMNGFEKELRARILGLASHATVAGAGNPLKNWKAAAEIAKRHELVVGVAPYITSEGMFAAGANVQGTIVRGILPALEKSVSTLEKYLVVGKIDDLSPGAYRIIVGKTLADRLGVWVGDRITLIAPQAKVTPAGILPQLRRFTIVGVFEIGHGQYDSGFALMHLEDAARLFRYGDGVSGLRLKLSDLYQARAVSRHLAALFGGRFFVSDWTQHHANFFRALATEKTVMFVILTLIIAVAAFNIVSTMVMVVTDKEAEIAILRTLGLTPLSVMKIFVVQGTVIGIVGICLGAVGGVVLAENVDVLIAGLESLLGTKFLDPDIYYISDVPSDLRAYDVAVTLCVAFGMSVLATLYPSWRASRTDPADALRYE